MKKKYEKPQIEVIDVAPVELCALSNWRVDNGDPQKIRRYDNNLNPEEYDAFDDVNW